MFSQLLLLLLKQENNRNEEEEEEEEEEGEEEEEEEEARSSKIERHLLLFIYRKYSLFKGNKVNFKDSQKNVSCLIASIYHSTVLIDYFCKLKLSIVFC